MAHNINTYIGRQAAWHALGTVTGKYFSWQEALAMGGLDFQVIKNQLEYQGSRVNAYGIFRTDNGEFLGSVGEGYEPIQHAEGFGLVDALVSSTNGAHYETVGVLGAGEKVWGLADLKLSVSVGNDRQNAYLLFSTSHDGSLSHTYRTCLTRVVCQNTLSVALGEKTKAVFRVKHTKNALQRIGDAHKALAGLASDVKSIEEKLNILATRKVTKDSLISVMDRLFPAKEDSTGKKVDSTRRDNILAGVLSLYESNDRNAFPEQRGTLYNLLNAVTEYTDHERSTRNDGRAESALFGSGDALKSKALVTLVEVAGSSPEIAKPVYMSVSNPNDFSAFMRGIGA